MKTARTTSRAPLGILIAILLLSPLGAPVARAEGNGSRHRIATGGEPLLSLAQFLDGQLLSLRDWRRLLQVSPVEATAANQTGSVCRGRRQCLALGAGLGEAPVVGSLAAVEVAPR